MIPGARIRYLAEIAEQGRSINETVDQQAASASQLRNIYTKRCARWRTACCRRNLSVTQPDALTAGGDKSLLVLRQRYHEVQFGELICGIRHQLLRGWPERKAGIKSERHTYTVRGREITGNNFQ